MNAPQSHLNGTDVFVCSSIYILPSSTPMKHAMMCLKYFFLILKLLRSTGWKSVGLDQNENYRNFLLFNLILTLHTLNPWLVWVSEYRRDVKPELLLYDYLNTAFDYVLFCIRWRNSKEQLYCLNKSRYNIVFTK
jgi:hypothetical protein